MPLRPVRPVMSSVALCYPLLLLFTVTEAQPILPSLSYPVFVYTPTLEQPEETPAPQVPEEGFEVSQFHSQDEAGRVVFGFHGPDQSRMEARSLDGSVRGSYSYIDPYGHIVKMQYWDDGAGFHVAGNSLPGGPQYTPEVAAAREQHLRIYKQTLAAAHNLIPQSDESAFADSPDNDPSVSTSKFEDVSQFQKEPQDNSLFEDDKESISLENPELLGNHNMFEQDDRKEKKKPGKDEVEGEIDLGEDVGPDDEFDQESYENDRSELNNHKFSGEVANYRTGENDGHDDFIIRYKHSIKENDREEEGHNEDEIDRQDSDEGYNHDSFEEHSLEEEYEGHSEEQKHSSSESHESDNECDGATECKGLVKKTVEKHLHKKHLHKHYDAETGENRNTEIKLDAPPIMLPDTITEKVTSNDELIIPVDQSTANSKTKSKIVPPTVKRRAFFYHFQHTIPKPTERIEEDVEKGLRFAAAIRDPPSAVHDAQMSPYRFFSPYLSP